MLNIFIPLVCSIRNSFRIFKFILFINIEFHTRMNYSKIDFRHYHRMFNVPLYESYVYPMQIIHLFDTARQITSELILYENLYWINFNRPGTSSNLNRFHKL